jgi:hypothetical protein
LQRRGFDGVIREGTDEIIVFDPAKVTPVSPEGAEGEIAGGGPDPIHQVSLALKEAKKVRPKTEAEQKAERKKRVGAAAGTMEANLTKGTPAEEAIFRSTGLLKGPLAEYNQLYEPIRDRLNEVNPDAINSAFKQIADNPDLQYFDKVNTADAFRTLIDGGALTYRQIDLVLKWLRSLRNKGLRRLLFMTDCPC